MFMKQYNYKPRSGSQSSQGSSGQAIAGSPPKEEAKTTSTAGAAGIAAQAMGGPQANAAGRRRSSAAGADKFAGLASHKRGGSGDQTMEARKASWADQKPGQTGILGGMWSNFTKGS